MSTKKIVIVGDKLLDSTTIAEAIRTTVAHEWEIVELTFGPDDLGALDRELGKMEAAGAEAVAPPAELLSAVADAQVLLTHMCPVNTAVFEAASHLELVGVLRGGVENVNVAAATSHGIPVFNTLGRTSEAVSDYTIGLMLSEMRNIARSYAGVRAGKWPKEFPNSGQIPEMRDLTVGLVGFGEIGRLVFEKLQGFGTSVQVYDPYVTADRVPAGCKLVPDLADLLRTSDVVTLHARHEVGAPPIVTREHVELLRSNAYLINTARAGIIDMDALVEALAAGRIAGAALDVFELEPLPQASPLLSLDNVTLTSHIAFDTAGFYAKSPVLWLEGFRSFLAHGTDRSLITKDLAGAPQLKNLVM